jgi:hypothetical protein
MADGSSTTESFGLLFLPRSPNSRATVTSS